MCGYHLPVKVQKNIQTCDPPIISMCSVCSSDAVCTAI